MKKVPELQCFNASGVRHFV